MNMQDNNSQQDISWELIVKLLHKAVPLGNQYKLLNQYLDYKFQ
jgi:hypothetical protein